MQQFTNTITLKELKIIHSSIEVYLRAESTARWPNTGTA
jgi:hypothetical protein